MDVCRKISGSGAFVRSLTVICASSAEGLLKALLSCFHPDMRLVEKKLFLHAGTARKTSRVTDLIPS